MKPEYSVPSMEEISKIPWNGFNVCSTFAGCGGSSTGYRMSGYRVLWANEYDEHAQKCYAENSKAIVNGRSIVDVKPEEILESVGLASGELDIFDGSPPCQGFSTSGKRDVSDLRNTLFWQYSRLVRGLRPKVFVAENVSGLIKGTMKGMFFEILQELKSCGYKVSCRVLDAQWLGVPQRRRRTIFVGVREDLNLEPVHPSPLKYRYSVRDACPWIGTLAYKRGEKSKGSNWEPYNKSLDVHKEPVGVITASSSDSRYWSVGVPLTGKHNAADVRFCPDTGMTLTLRRSRKRACDGEDVFGSVEPVEAGRPSPTILATVDSNPLKDERRNMTIGEVKRLCSFPDDFILTGSYAKQWARLGNSVPPVMMFHIASTIRDRILREL